MQREPLERLFLREKPVLAILAVSEMERAYAALIAKQIDSTFPHTCSILGEMEDLGLIKSRPEGRINYLELTDRGRDVVKALKELSELLKKPEAMRQKLERLQRLASQANGRDEVLRLGPLRRDLAKLKIHGDRQLQEAAEELDRSIEASVRESSPVDSISLSK